MLQCAKIDLAAEPEVLGVDWTRYKSSYLGGDNQMCEDECFRLDECLFRATVYSIKARLRCIGRRKSGLLLPLEASSGVSSN